MNGKLINQKITIIVVLHLKRFFAIFILLFGLLGSMDLIAQTGGRKREHRNQRRGGSKIFGKSKSRGNANAFAKGSRGNIFQRMFHKKQPSWVYHSTKSNTRSRNENRFLFKRTRTKGRKSNESILARQNAERSKKRSRGNAVFHKRKYAD